jgi:hypothetical protein
MIQNKKLIIDITNCNKDIFSCNKLFFKELICNYADKIYIDDSLHRLSNFENVEFLENIFDVKINMSIIISSKEELNNLNGDDIYFKLCYYDTFDKGFEDLKCKKIFYLNYSNESSFINEINFIYKIKVDLILTNFLPDELPYHFDWLNNSAKYFLNNFQFIDHEYFPCSGFSQSKKMEIRNGLIIFDSTSTVLNHKTDNLILKTLENAGYKKLDISSTETLSLFKLLQKMIVKSKVVISTIQNPSVNQIIGSVCELYGSKNISLNTCITSPLRFLISGQEKPIISEGYFHENNNISIRQKILNIIRNDPSIKKEPNIPASKNIYNKSNFIHKFENRITGFKISSIEQIYSYHSVRNKNQNVGIKLEKLPENNFPAWFNNPFAEIILERICHNNLNSPKLFDEVQAKKISEDLIQLLCLNIPNLVHNDWHYRFLSKLASNDDMAKMLEKIFISLFQKQTFVNADNISTFRLSVWPFDMWFDLLNQEKRVSLQGLLKLGEKFMLYHLKKDSKFISSVSWLLLFLLYQGKVDDALSFIDNNKLNLDNSFIDKNRIQVIQTLWCMGNEESAKKVILEYDYVLERLTHTDLLIYAIFTALSSCWEQAELAYSILHKVNPTIFHNNENLLPRNFWLYQAIVYKKVGNTSGFCSFINKAELIDKYWTKQKVLLDRHITIDKKFYDFVPLFNIT